MVSGLWRSAVQVLREEKFFSAKSSFMTCNVAKSRPMSAAIGCQPWDAGPMAAMKALKSDNPGFDPQVETNSYT